MATDHFGAPLSTDSAAVLAAGLDGLGIIEVSYFVAAHHLASGALLQVLPGWRSRTMPLFLVTPWAKQRTARVVAFMQWAQQLLAQRLGPPVTLPTAPPNAQPVASQP